MIFFAFLTLAMGVFCWFFPEEWKTDVPQEDLMVIEIYKYILPVIGGFNVILFAIPFFLKPKPGVWIFHIVLMALSMGSCLIVAAIPLLIFYLKPEAKVYFGKNP